MRGLLLAIALVGLAGIARADRAPQTDNRIAALDARSGEVSWVHAPAELSHAHLELHRQTLTVYPQYDGSERSGAFHLDPRSGAPTAAPPAGSKPLARSVGFWPPPPIRLSNGWELTGFEPGNSQSLDFRDASGAVVWRIATQGYPHQIAATQDMVFWSFSYLTDEGVVYADRAGGSATTSAPSKAPARLWTFDVNAAVSAAAKLTRPFLQVIDGELFVGANEHLFQLEPKSGKLLRRWDLAKLAGVPFQPGLYQGGLNLASLARDDETMVVSYEARMLAIDRRSGRLLWHHDPRSVSTPFPVVHGGKVFTLWGKAAPGPSARPAAAPEPAAAEEPTVVPAAAAPAEPPPVAPGDRCGCRAPGAGDRSGALPIVALWLVALSVASRKGRSLPRPARSRTDPPSRSPPG